MAIRRVRRPRRMQPEHRIQNDIIAALRVNGNAVYRINVGRMKTKDGRYFSTGAPKGFPDLFGTRKSDHQTFFIEVKTPTGRIQQSQMLFHLDLMHQGVIHGIARSIDDALKIVNEGLIGYGFPDYKQK